MLSYEREEDRSVTEERLAERAGLDETEAMMMRLAVGTSQDPAGIIVQQHLLTGGKRLRARLALAAVEALGGVRQRAVPWAAACELIHNATLIHDDVQDGDSERRGQPATWARFGAAQAINAGDLLLMLPFAALDELSGFNERSEDIRWKLARALARAADRTARGQAAEFDLLPSKRFDWESYRRAAQAKSGALIGLPLEGAALLSGLSNESSARLGDEFAKLGTVYQLVDDLSDLSGPKPGNDLREGKVSALVVEHWRLFPKERTTLQALLLQPRDHTPDNAVSAMLQRFQEGGAKTSVIHRLEEIEDSLVKSPWLLALPAVRQLALEALHQIQSSLPL